MNDLIIRGGRLANGQLVDIAINDGRISTIASQVEDTGLREIAAEGRLTIPAFVNGQLHACKSFWRRLLSQLPPDIQALPRFEAASHVKELYTAENVFERVDEVMLMAVQNGTCAIRLFGDVDEASGVSAIEGLLAIKAKYASLMTVQVVAFPQDGVLNRHTQALMHQALEMGADIVGGIPWIEPNAQAQHAHTEMCFRLAKAFGRDVHFVCDDVADPACRTLELMARLTIENELHGRVSATQCAALSFYPDDYAAHVISLVKESDMTVFANSHVSLIAAEFDPQQHPWPRGTTRIRQLIDAGVPVACAQDDIDNWFYPFGRNDMLEVAHYMAHTGQFAWRGEVDQVLPMVTQIPAAVLGVPDYGLHEGAAANLLILDAPDWHSAVQFQVDKRFVILNGKITAETQRTSKVYGIGPST